MDFTEEDVRKPLNEAMAEGKVRAAVAVNDENTFGKVFAGKTADHIESTAGTGRQHFGPDKSYRSNLDRSALRAAWRMIRRDEAVDE